MRIRELFDRVMLESGQFLISNEEIELDVDKFSILVRVALGVFNKHHPFHVHHTIDTGSNFEYVFQDSSTDWGIPDWIADIVPIRLVGSLPKYLLSAGLFSGTPVSGWTVAPNSWLEIKSEFPWTYRNPKLHVPIVGEYDCKLVFNHKLKQLDEADNVKDFEITTISHENDEFFTLLTGKFMRALAMSRRAFTMNDLPISTDADTLASEGKEMEAKALEDLESKSQKWWLAWH